LPKAISCDIVKKKNIEKIPRNHSAKGLKGANMELIVFYYVCCFVFLLLAGSPKLKDRGLRLHAFISLIISLNMIVLALVLLPIDIGNSFRYLAHCILWFGIYGLSIDRLIQNKAEQEKIIQEEEERKENKK